MEYEYYFDIRDSDKRDCVNIKLLRGRKDPSVLFAYRDTSLDVVLRSEMYIPKTKDQIQRVVDDMRSQLSVYELDHDTQIENERKARLAEQEQKDCLKRFIESVHKKPFDK